MVTTLDRATEYKISTVNDSRFVSAQDIASKLREQGLSMCAPDKCTIDYSDNCGLTADDCTIDY
jgi:hypothetical protein